MWCLYIHNTVKKKLPHGPLSKPTSHINHVLVFVAASEKDQSLLPACAASVGLSIHTAMQTAAVQQQKAATVIYLSKTFFGSYSCGSRRNQTRRQHFAEVQDKNHRDARQVIRSVTDADVYMYSSSWCVEDYVGCGARLRELIRFFCGPLSVKFSGGKSTAY